MNNKMYKTCPHCGANLDHGEICDCQHNFGKEGQRAGRFYAEYMENFIATGRNFKDGCNAAPAQTAESAFIAFYKHTLDAALDAYGIPKEQETGGAGAEESACDNCQCETCANLENCTVYPTIGDRIIPPSCTYCISKRLSRGLTGALNEIDNPVDPCVCYKPKTK